MPSAQERNDISADVILAKELERLVSRRGSVMTECVNSFLPGCHGSICFGGGRFNGFYRITAR
jgi:hypothetical protein